VSSVIATVNGENDKKPVLAGFACDQRRKLPPWNSGLVLLLYAATAWIRQRVGQAELKTREKLLEIELRVAGIAEALDVKNTAK
jgi:hypothetical protein